MYDIHIWFIQINFNPIESVDASPIKRVVLVKLKKRIRAKMATVFCVFHSELFECANFLLLETASFHVWNFALQFLTDM